MAYPKRIVRVEKDQATGARTDYIQHGGQKYRLCERAISAQRGWVWVWEQDDLPGSAPGLILYDSPDGSSIIGRADPDNKWIGTEVR